MILANFDMSDERIEFYVDRLNKLEAENDELREMNEELLKC